MAARSGRLVKPGQYTIRLITVGRVFSTALEVREDPRVNASREDFVRQDEMLAAIESGVAEIHQRAAQIRSVRSQLADILAHTSNSDVVVAAKSLDSRLAAIEDVIVAAKPTPGQKFVVEPPCLVQVYKSLHADINQVKPEVTGGVGDVFIEISRQWAYSRAQLAKLLGPGVDAFNQLASRGKIPAITAPK